MPNSDEAFNRHNPMLTEAMAQVDRGIADEYKKRQYADKDQSLPGRDAVLYAIPNYVDSTMQSSRAIIEDLEYRSTILVDEIERLHALLADVRYTLEIHRNVLQNAPPPQPTASSSGRLGSVPQKAY